MPTPNLVRPRLAVSLLMAAAVGAPWRCLPVAAADPAPVAEGQGSDRHPDLRRLSPTEEIWVDPVRQEVIVGGAIAMDRGLIEVFACPRHTKEHEAIVATAASARLVHAALLAIGLEPGRPVSFDPVYAAAVGPPVAILVRWTDEHGRPHEHRAQELIRSTTTKAALDADWVFAGSVFWKDPSDGQEYYQADGGDLICVSNFPTATLDLPLESSQSNDALMFEACEGRVPPRGTAVELVLSAKRPPARQPVTRQ